MSTTPLLLLHGFLGDVADFEGVADGIDGIGTGPRGRTFDEEVARILARMDGVPRFDVCGYSMGGRLAYGVLARAQDRVRRFVVLGARVARADAARADRDEAWAALAEAEGLEGFLERWYAQPLFAALRQHPHFDEILRRRQAHNDADDVARVLRALGPAQQPDFTEVLRTTSCPGLLLAGARDGFYVAQNQACADANPHLQAAVIPDAGHALLAEAPEAVAARLAEFLA